MSLDAHCADVLEEVLHERERQDAKWGEQNHPDGTQDSWFREFVLPANVVRTSCNNAFAQGMGSFAFILAEEVAEALEETDRAKLRVELIQVAAVAVNWIQAIDRRAKP